MGKKASYDDSTIELITKITSMGIKDGLAGSVASLAGVMKQFEQFQIEFPFLWAYKIITADNNFNFKWNYSTTSLAEYFDNLKENRDTSKTKFFWENIENTFSYKKGVLRQYAYNASTYGQSKDYEKIQNILECLKVIDECNRVIESAEKLRSEKIAYLEKLTNLENL